MLDKKLSFLLLPFVISFTLEAKEPTSDPFFQDPFGDNIFKEMMAMQKDMDAMFQRMHNRMQQRTSRQVSPMGTFKIQNQGHFVDKGDHYSFTTTIPESKDNQIDLNTQNAVMSITAKIIQKQENNTTHGYSSSSSMRMYQQRMLLPSDADESTINMQYVDKLLVISVEKKSTDSLQKSVPLAPALKKEEKVKSESNSSSIKKLKLDDTTSLS